MRVQLTRGSSLLDACTGYDATQAANFKWPNGTVQFTDDIYAIAADINIDSK